MSASLVTAIILNWNSSEFAIRSAQSLLCSYSQSGVSPDALQLIIVDNGSDEADRVKLEAWCSQAHSHRVSFIQNPDNVGFAAGMNAGIFAALQYGTSYLWLLNNDTEVAPGAVAALLEFSSARKEAVVVGSTMLERAGGPLRAAGGYRYFSCVGWSAPIGAGIELDKLQPAQLRDPDYVDGAAIWVRADFVRRAGGLPAAGFMYFEELLLNEHLRPGERVAWCPGAHVVHFGGAASQALPPGRAGYHAALAAFRYTRATRPLCLPTVILARVVGVGALALYTGQPARFREVLRALWVFLSGR